MYFKLGRNITSHTTTHTMRPYRHLKWMIVLITLAVLCMILLNTYTRIHNNFEEKELESGIFGKQLFANILQLQTSEFESELDKVHYERRKNLLDACHRKEFQNIGNNSENIIRNHFVVDRKNKMVYCAMEKIGSTFWRRLFQITSGASKSSSPFQIPPGYALGGHVETFSKLYFDDLHTILSTSVNFVFTRHPFERLLSGYVDKLFSPNVVYWSMVGTYAIKLLRKNASSVSLDCGHDLTFPEFVKYFIHSQKYNKHRDGHFIPMYDHCRPCQIKFNIIGKMETFQEDTLYILKKLNFTKLHSTLKQEFVNQTRQDSFRDQVSAMMGFPSNKESCLNVYDRHRRMWKKMQIRGLISKYSRYPYNEKTANTVTEKDYLRALDNAVKGTRDASVARKYRHEAIVEAYSNVPKSDLLILQQIFEPDCKIFGYDCDINEYILSSSSQTFYFNIQKA